MKITGTNTYMDVEHTGKKARFAGEFVCSDEGKITGFRVYADSMQWLSPYDEQPVTLAEREAWIAAVLKESDGKEFQIRFE